MTRFDVEIPLRWADLDAYRHVNHARTVTLLEEARVHLVFHQAARHGVGALAGDPVAATARTQMVPYDLAAGRPRRLTAPEHDFLARWSADGTGTADGGNVDPGARSARAG